MRPTSLRASARRRSAIVVHAALACAIVSFAARAHAQRAARGFALERFSPSPAGAGWLVGDALDLDGPLGGAAAATFSYAHAPLRIARDGAPLRVVSSMAFVDFGAAVTFDRFRFHIDAVNPLFAKGNDGVVGGVAYSAPDVDPSSSPDGLADVRIGFDVRLLGAHDGPIRCGVGWQLFVPVGDRDDDFTDATYRGVGKLMIAGDIGHFSYAAHLGVHLRSLDDRSTAQTPRGSEALFGASLGARVPLDARARTTLLVGPEIFGATASRPFFADAATAIEALLTAAIARGEEDGIHVRARVGAGGGVHAAFGAPEWRAVIGIEVVDHVD